MLTFLVPGCAGIDLIIWSPGYPDSIIRMLGCAGIDLIIWSPGYPDSIICRAWVYRHWPHYLKPWSYRHHHFWCLGVQTLTSLSEALVIQAPSFLVPGCTDIDLIIWSPGHTGTIISGTWVYRYWSYYLNTWSSREYHFWCLGVKTLTSLSEALVI